MPKGSVPPEAVLDFLSIPLVCVLVQWDSSNTEDLDATSDIKKTDTRVK